MPRWATALNFVIPSVAEGPAVRLPSNNSLQLRPSISTNAKVGSCPQLCHPERSRGTCGAPFPLTTPYSSVHPSPPMRRWATALNFVIPSVAEGPAVRLPSNNSLQLRPSISTNAKVGHCPQLCHPERSRGTCGAPFPLTTPYSSCHPSPPMPRWATALNFVIPSVAEGPAVRPSL